MQHQSAQPTRSRVLSLIWFPFFFAAAFAFFFIAAFAHPEPHDIDVGVVTPATVESLSTEVPPGIELVSASTDQEARHLVETNQLAAATDGTDLFIASAASSTRAEYLTTVFGDTLGSGMKVSDVRPLPAGDASGVGLFFWALPNLLVGLITSIVLLQFGPWPLYKKITTIAATGAFSAIFSYILGLSFDIIPHAPLLMLFAFMLTQAIGWVTTAAALLVKQFFMPVAITFVLVLGIPSSGGTVNGDMLPNWLAFIGRWHPFGQFVDLIRSSAYLGDLSLRSIWALSGWMVLGAGLLVFYKVRSERQRRQQGQSVRTVPVESASGSQTLTGSVTSVSSDSVAGAHIIALNDQGERIAETTTDEEGRYALVLVPHHTYYVVVAAPHVDPMLKTVNSSPHYSEHVLDMTVTDWSDPALITQDNE